MITTANLPVFDREKILLYYGGANMSHGAGEPGNPYDESIHRFKVGLTTLRRDGFVYAWSRSGCLQTKALQCRSGLIRINADCTKGRILVAVMREGRRIKTFELAGVNVLGRRFYTGTTGEIVLNVTIENARLCSLEII